MILSRYSWTIYVALWFFVISRKLWERESLLQKRNKYNLLIFCFLFLKIRLIVLLELKAFSCDFGIGTFILCCCCSITKLSDSVAHGLLYARIPSPSLSPGVCSNSFPWYYPTILSFVAPFSSALNLSQHQGLFQWVRSSLII